MNPNNREKVKKAIVQAIQQSGKNAFMKSRIRVPVVTGALRDSGKGEDIGQGFLLEYSKYYASFVNRGVKPGIRHINGYYRKDGAYIKSHSYYHSGQKSQKYIDGPMEEEFKSQGFVNSLDAALRKNFGNVTRQ